MTYTCYKCNTVPVPQEYSRCAECEKAHKELCIQLDARPRTKEKKVKQELFPIKEMRGGIQVTTWIDREDAANMGIKI